MVRAADTAILGYHEYGADEVREDLTAPDAPVETDHWLVLDGSGRVAGWGYLREERAGAGTSDEYVRPGAHPAVGPWLLERVLERAAERARAAGLPAYEVSTGCYVKDETWREWFAAAGFTAVRRFHRMAIDLTTAPPPPAVPEGVTVRAVGPDPQARRDMYDVEQAAFVDHWDFHPEPYGKWSDNHDRSAGYAPDQWWVAYVGDTPAAGLISSDRMSDEGIGYVRTLGVAPAYRGRGLAKLLLRHAFAEFAARGRTAARLGVDSENPTGALALYEAVGMHAVLSLEAWRAHAHA